MYGASPCCFALGASTAVFPGPVFVWLGAWPSADESDGGVEGENLDEMLENHDGRLPEGDGDGGVPFRSSELVRFKLDLGMGIGLASAAPLSSVRPWVLVEFERCRVFAGAGIAIVSEVAVVVVGGGGEPMGWRGGGDDFCCAFFGAEGGVFFGALSVTRDMLTMLSLHRARGRLKVRNGI